ncbi:MAG: hypothetical protein WCO68_08045 [Verrucomicrobiota bacterium]
MLLALLETRKLASLALAVAAILSQLAQAEARYPGHPQLVELSLVARRLIVLAACGLDSRDAVTIRLFLHGGGGRLPAVRCLPPMNPNSLVNAGDAVRLHFISDVERYFGADSLAVRPRQVNGDENEESEAIVRFSTLYRKAANRKSVGYEDGDDEEALVIESPRAIRQYAGLSLAGDLLACGTRHIELGIAVLQVSALFDERAWRCLRPAELASWIIALLSLMIGIPPRDLLRFPLTPTKAVLDDAMGALDLSRSLLRLFPGNGCDDGLFGRIPRGQIIEFQLPGTLHLLCKLLTMSLPNGAATLQGVIGASALDVYCRHIALRLENFRPARQRKLEAQLCRLHDVWTFSGLVLAGTPPGIMALLCRRTVSPFRSDSNYFSVSRLCVQHTLTAICEAEYQLAGFPPEGNIPVIVNPGEVGVDAPDMNEVVGRFEGMVHASTPKQLHLMPRLGMH